MNWYYSKNGSQLGPISEQEFAAKVGSGQILATDLVWKEGMTDWKPLSQCTEYAGTVAPVIPSVMNTGGGQIPMQQPMAYPSGHIHVQVPNYLWQSIVVTLLCCWPLGVVGIVFAAKVDGLVARGDYAGAQAASKSAKTWTIAAFASGLAVVLIYIVLIVSGVMVAGL